MNQIWSNLKWKKKLGCGKTLSMMSKEREICCQKRGNLSCIYPNRALRDSIKSDTIKMRSKEFHSLQLCYFTHFWSRCKLITSFHSLSFLLVPCLWSLWYGLALPGGNPSFSNSIALLFITALLLTLCYHFSHSKYPIVLSKPSTFNQSPYPLISYAYFPLSMSSPQPSKTLNIV